MTSMISDETLQKIEDKLEELSHKIKALELLKLSMSSLENQSPIFTKNVGILGALDVTGTTSLDGGVAITGSATIGANDILTTASTLDLRAYGTANADGATVPSGSIVPSNGKVLFNAGNTVSGGVNIDPVSGKITLPAGGSYLISVDLDANSTNTSADVSLSDGTNPIVGGRIITASKSSGNASFILEAATSLDFYITNFSANTFVHNGGSISIVRVGPVSIV